MRCLWRRLRVLLRNLLGQEAVTIITIHQVRKGMVMRVLKEWLVDKVDVKRNALVLSEFTRGYMMYKVEFHP